MKINMIAATIVATTIAVFQTMADAPDPMQRRLSKDEFQKLPPDQRKIYLDRISYINNGGRVVKENTGKGVVKVIVSTDKFDTKILKRPLLKVERFMRIKIDVSNGGSAIVQNAKDQMAITKSNVAVFVTENPGLPRLLSAPEEGWAIVNVLALEEGNPSKEVFEKRVVKEVMRATSLATGCANVGGCMQPVSDVKSLDFLVAEAYPLNARPQIYKTLEEFGIEPRVETSYKTACQQGWAPAPTNDIQKAIWDKVHSIPENPIQIKFDSKKGR